jgi:putative transposase
MMDLVEDIEPPVPVTRACEALGLSRATLYRRTQPSPPRRPSEPRRAPRKLSDDERLALLDVLHHPEFVDQPPAEVYAALLSRGEYVASIRTMYRVLKAEGESNERRTLRSRVSHPAPMVSASAPNEVWTWDITLLPGPVPGVFYYLYVILDLFSRYVVGWLLAERQNAALAKQLFADALLRHGIEPGRLVLHSDRGGPMKSKDLGQFLALLGVARSFSRPRVSNDNPFSEAQFKTFKYQPDYPGRFACYEEARLYCQEVIGWHNEQHHHSGLALFTPADVFHGRVSEVAAVRQAALDAAYAAHPERFPRGAPQVALPPAVVSINPLAGSSLIVAGESCPAAPQEPPTTGNDLERHGARHGVVSCPAPTIVLPSLKGPSVGRASPAHHPAAELGFPS